MNRIEALNQIVEWLGHRAHRTPERKRRGARAAHAAAYVVFCEERSRVFGGDEFLRMAQPHQEALHRISAELVEGVESLRQFLVNAPTDQLVEYADQLAVDAR